MRTNSDRFYLENILAHIPEYVFWKDLKSIYVGCNHNFAMLAGLKSIEEVTGRTDEELPWSQYAKDIYLKEDKQIIETQQPINHEAVPFVDADGTQRIIMISKSPLFDENNKIIGILGIFHDITELKNAQQALLKQIKETERAYHSKTEFLSMTTHEIRNPVGNITLFAGFLKEELKKLKSSMKEVSADNGIFAQVMEKVEIIEHESHKALDYLKSLGELHRLEKEGVKPNFVSIKIQDLIERVIKNTTKYNTKNVEVMTSIDASFPDSVEIDYNNIYEALEVIVLNALRFSHEAGVVKLQIKAENNRVKIAVENSGESIAVSQINDLFNDGKNESIDPKAALYRKPSLRLTQAKLKIEAAGGNLEIERTNNGTKVSIDTLCNQSKTVKKMDAETITLSKSPQKKHKILIVDDDPLFLKSEKIILEGWGHLVSAASTGEDALKKLSEESYDIIFLDITLPDMSGVDIIKEIRKKNNELIIIVVTSHAHKADIEFFEETGATLVLTKPVSPEKFQECLEFDFDDDEN